MIWFGLVLWHINHCRLFNAKSSLYIHCNIARYTDTWIVHRIFIMSITHIYNIGIPNHKNTNDFLVQIRNFLLRLSLKVFRHKKREIPSFYTDFSNCPSNTCGVRSAQIRLASPSSQSQLTYFSQITPNPPRTLPVHDVIHIPRSQLSIRDFYFDISEWHILPARASTPAVHVAPN